MGNTMTRRIAGIIIALAIQVLFLNNMHIAGYITPIIIGYPLTCFHRESSRYGLLILGFLSGLVYDIFSDTMGMGTISSTLLAFVQQPILNLFKPRDAADDFSPTIRALGAGHYIAYITSCMIIYHLSFYLLDAFSVAYIPLTALAIIGGTVLSVVLITIYESVIRSDRR
jgi:rod shape-determining protein MreD